MLPTLTRTLTLAQALTRLNFLRLRSPAVQQAVDQHRDAMFTCFLRVHRVALTIWKRIWPSWRNKRSPSIERI